ncbi:retrotransposon nucleocapsid protein [Gigaspora margarita]|uniref:Retrotransposon nucleocapsid protein n=1 Tax=Gigaspora margarita TaxID=4874 RepID=A0A8H3XG45_GIGMA|nr:retrotransposon nucleocapsid protein [Gigaspora margarita]
MEYTFISRDTLDQIVEKYITNLPKAKQKKALINNELLNQIKTILLNPKDISLCDKNTKSWAKKRFVLEEIVPEDYRIINRRPRHPQSQGLVERAKGILEQKLGKWRETTGRNDWSFVYGDKPRGNCSLVNELFANNIFDEETIPDTIEILNNDETDLGDDMTEFLSDNPEQSPDHIGLPAPSNYHTGLPVPSPERSVFSPKSPVFLSNNYVSYLGSVSLSNNYVPSPGSCSISSPDNYAPSPNNHNSYPVSSPINLATPPNNYVSSSNSSGGRPMPLPAPSSNIYVPSPNSPSSRSMPSPNSSSSRSMPSTNSSSSRSMPSPINSTSMPNSYVSLPNNHVGCPVLSLNNYSPTSHSGCSVSSPINPMSLPNNYVFSPNKYGGCPVPSPENYVPSPDRPGSPMSSPINLAPLPNNYMPLLNNYVGCLVPSYVLSPDSPGGRPMPSSDSPGGCPMPSPNNYVPSPNSYVGCLVPLPDNHVPSPSSHSPVPSPDSSGSCSVSLPDNDLGSSEPSLKIRNNSKSSPSDYALADITNNSSNSERHEMLREAAQRNLQQVNIPKIDRFSIDRLTLPCKILEKTREDRYKLGCKFGVISVCYSSSELEALGAIT